MVSQQSGMLSALHTKTLSESISVSPFFSLTGLDLHVSLIGWCRFKMEPLLPADWLGAEGGRQCV